VPREFGSCGEGSCSPGVQTSREIDIKMRIISIEGLPGAGKTTFVKNILPLLPKKSKIMFEPVANFESFSFYNPLHELYQDPIRNCTACQFHIIDVLSEQYKGYLMTNTDVLISDRCLGTVEVFTNTLHRMNYISPFTRDFILTYYNRRKDSLFSEKKFGCDAMFYIDVPSEVSLARIQKRGRLSEENVSLEYIECLKEEYEMFLARAASQ